MFDTWTIQPELLNMEKVKTFANKVFSCLPDRARRVESTIRLAKMLKTHKMTRSSTEIHLFKSTELGDAVFHEVFRPDLTTMMSRSITANGLDRYSEAAVHTYLVTNCFCKSMLRAIEIT
ncbi:hypothetical protein OESDEN_00186 [Oesophagostomum dentatum]|uniref:Uncharacterized protein n=1 Tax=Oesophagostomum dentatum TaxID=61180 RepID=A0A0B1TVD6_OESDE|nr:hypothetical protein OESDEN_00186 [Oesophagostomum dentatum]